MSPGSRSSAQLAALRAAPRGRTRCGGQAVRADLGACEAPSLGPEAGDFGVEPIQSGLAQSAGGGARVHAATLPTGGDHRANVGQAEPGKAGFSDRRQREQIVRSVKTVPGWRPPSRGEETFAFVDQNALSGHSGPPSQLADGHLRSGHP